MLDENALLRMQRVGLQMSNSMLANGFLFPTAVVHKPQGIGHEGLGKREREREREIGKKTGAFALVKWQHNDGACWYRWS